MSNNVTGSGTPTFSAIGPSDTAAEDGGIIVKGTSDKTFLWRGTDGGVTYNYWNSSEHINTAAGKNYYVNSILFASDTNKVIGPTNGGGQGQVNLAGGGTPYTLGSAVTGSSLTSVGTLTSLSISGNIEPTNDNTQNLGASNKRWANVYSGDVHLNNTGMGGNEVDGTEGNWTMQEGADDLFLINRITGKKYKFNLTEV